MQLNVLPRIPSYEVLWGPAPIDWCEPNRPEHNLFGVKELHNTWTNVGYMLAALLLGCRHRDWLLRSGHHNLLILFVVMV